PRALSTVIILPPAPPAPPYPTITHKLFFLFTHTAPTQIYPLSLHDALPISRSFGQVRKAAPAPPAEKQLKARFSFSCGFPVFKKDRKSTRLNSSHVKISYAVFCLKKKKKIKKENKQITRQTRQLYIRTHVNG